MAVLNFPLHLALMYKRELEYIIITHNKRIYPSFYSPEKSKSSALAELFCKHFSRLTVSVILLLFALILAAVLGLGVEYRAKAKEGRAEAKVHSRREFLVSAGRANDRRYVEEYRGDIEYHR